MHVLFGSGSQSGGRLLGADWLRVGTGQIERLQLARVGLVVDGSRQTGFKVEHWLLDAARVQRRSVEAAVELEGRC